MFDGPGFLQICSDYTYEGQFQQGQIEGKGEFQAEKMFKYTGDFQNSKFHGKGTEIHEDDIVGYEGDYLKGFK